MVGAGLGWYAANKNLPTALQVIEKTLIPPTCALNICINSVLLQRK